MFLNRGGQKVRKGLYILAVMLTLGLPLVLPLRIESSIFIFLVGLSVVSYAIAFASFRLIKRRFGSVATFGYNPTTTYMTGNKAKKAKRYRPPGKGEDGATSIVVLDEAGQAEKIMTPRAGRGDKNVHL
jgi:hypothetical protein